ncbi:HAMP domain-containing sensor histidine kinase [Paenibacillus macerans]|uniref:HAMP domain-containing sensor histidine kinase n=1 Tax=Paenibacillus macerans TaxID=44252 RepID=UPI00203F333B|nr:HAMP domain-containing sensor histidine kinase [Paenibacillus macerans]MCM3700706.1 HAMP domain-containing histidine kinase [Paenibacillus macerans]
MDRVKRFWNNLSIRTVLVIYTIFFMLLATVSTFVTLGILSRTEGTISGRYEKYEYSVFRDNTGREVGMAIGVPERFEYTPRDRFKLVSIHIAQVATIPVYYGGGILLAAFLFYRNKLKKPIELINRSARKIAESDLEFSLRYDSKDEMGKLCASLETMRQALETSQRSMWRMMEERKRLNAAFAHDLRTPLTVLRGYADFLCQYVPEGKVGQEKLIATLSSISRHTQRLENYVQTMSETNKLEDVEIRTEKIRVSDLTGQIASTAEALRAQSTVEISIMNRISAEYVCADAQVVLRVVENLLANALRFARERVEIGLSLEGGNLIIEVADNGDGFTPEALREAARPYYREGTVEPGHIHFGLGLYICKTLCERHGGQLAWFNQMQGGAQVTAQFLSAHES